ncbi:hypothetical protein FOA52_010332 [Chlamydomonas sp. UWO 241]|nr:hypothetical protein FOA52_010332 [Chlamydomonas sp. UWO 241]
MVARASSSKRRERSPSRAPTAPTISPISGSSASSSTTVQVVQRSTEEVERPGPSGREDLGGAPGSSSSSSTSRSARELDAAPGRGGGEGSRQWWSQLQERAGALLSSPYDSVILSLSGPAILALAADPLLSIVDTAIVGQLGSGELAALGVNTSLFGFAFVVFNFLSTATTPTVAAALAAGDTKRSGETVSQALVLATGIGAAVWVGLATNADASLTLMGLNKATDPHLFGMARDFLLLRASAAPAALLVTVSQGVFRGLIDMRTPLAVTLATNALHLALSLAFIFPGGMGLSGAALSTSIAEWGAAGTYLYLGWQRREQLGLVPLPDIDPRRAWRSYVPFLQSGGAVLMRTGVLLGTKTLASAVATRLGPNSIASHQVLYQIWILSSMLIDSVAIAGQTMIAVSLGQGEIGQARAITTRLLQMGAGLGIGLAAAFSISSPWWPHLFSSDPEVLSLVEPLVPLVVCMVPLNALVYVLDGVLVGASDFRFLVQAMVLASAGTVAGLLAVEPLGLGLNGVWAMCSLLMAMRLLTLGVRYASEDGPLPPSAAAAGAVGKGAGPGLRMFSWTSTSTSASASSSGSGSSGDEWPSAAADALLPALLLVASSSSNLSSCDEHPTGPPCSSSGAPDIPLSSLSSYDEAQMYSPGCAPPPVDCAELSQSVRVAADEALLIPPGEQ